MMMKSSLFALTAVILTACSAGPSTRLDMSPVHSDLELRAIVGTVMLRTVSLPAYAAAEEIAIETPEGFISSDADVLWADDPERAVTLAMTTHLGDILSATIGPDPWPFAGLADVSIDVRVQRMIAGADGVFRLSGQFFVGGDGVDFPNSAHSFDIETALAEPGTGAIADAQARALLQLSEQIARTLAR